MKKAVEPIKDCRIYDGENDNSLENNAIYIVSEKVLAKNWLSVKEDKAWQDL